MTWLNAVSLKRAQNRMFSYMKLVNNLQTFIMRRSDSMLHLVVYLLICIFIHLFHSDDLCTRIYVRADDIHERLFQQTAVSVESALFNQQIAILEADVGAVAFHAD